MRRSLRPPTDPARREFLRQGFLSLGVIAIGPTLHACGSKEDELVPVPAGGGAAGMAGGAGGMAGASEPDAAGGGGASGSTSVVVDPVVDAPVVSNLAELGPLGDPDANGVRLPPGYTSRIVARSGEQPVDGSGYVWHPSPDGGGVFPTDDGGWVYLSNSEAFPGGVGALRFDAEGNLVEAYRAMGGSEFNCAGGKTPWGTWLTCEELPYGKVWECDPLGRTEGVAYPALGLFTHEAAAVDPIHHDVYLTEDVVDGGFYRFVPDALTADGRSDLTAGRLEIAQLLPDGAILWHEVPDPAAKNEITRRQVPESSEFNGGEGIWYQDGIVYFSTKGDNRIWAYDIAGERVDIVYDRATSSNPVLAGVDNITMSCCGDVLVAEEGDDNQIVVVTAAGDVKPLLQVVGHDQSELTGPDFDPSGSRLYFSSQRGPTGHLLTGGITFEIVGPFHG